MKTFNAQRGFFDFGIGLGLLAIFGGTAAVVTTDHEEQAVVVEQQLRTDPIDMPEEITIVKSSEKE